MTEKVSWVGTSALNVYFYFPVSTSDYTSKYTLPFEEVRKGTGALRGIFETTNTSKDYYVDYVFGYYQLNSRRDTDTETSSAYSLVNVGYYLIKYMVRRSEYTVYGQSCNFYLYKNGTGGYFQMNSASKFSDYIDTSTTFAFKEITFPTIYY